MRQESLFQHAGEIWTVGYSEKKMEALIALLDDYRIDLVIDVRRSARSQYRPETNKAQLITTLGRNRYQHWPQLGNQKGAGAGWEPLDWEAAHAGIEKLKEMVGHTLRICLMCSEHDPGDCHRAEIAARVSEAVTHLPVA